MFSTLHKRAGDQLNGRDAVHEQALGSLLSTAKMKPMIPWLDVSSAAGCVKNVSSLLLVGGLSRECRQDMSTWSPHPFFGERAGNLALLEIFWRKGKRHCW